MLSVSLGGGASGEQLSNDEMRRLLERNEVVNPNGGSGPLKAPNSDSVNV